MPIPDFQTLIRPVLALHEDGLPHKYADLVPKLAGQFALSEEESNEKLPSGYKRFGSRVQWARTYLAQARLLFRPLRGVTQITQRGREALVAHPDRIDARTLQQYAEFREFQARHRNQETDTGAEQETSAPEERLEEASQELHEALAGELLDRILSASPRFFERIVLDLLIAMGYGGSREDAATHLGRSGDGGIDGSISEDYLGLDTLYVQAKRWSQDRHVSRPDIQAFVGALQGTSSSKGVFLTTTRFSGEAAKYAENIHGAHVVLVDGPHLASLLIEHGVGVSTARTHQVKQVDEDYFLGDAESEA